MGYNMDSDELEMAEHDVHGHGDDPSMSLDDPIPALHIDNGEDHEDHAHPHPFDEQASQTDADDIHDHHHAVDLVEQLSDNHEARDVLESSVAQSFDNSDFETPLKRRPLAGTLEAAAAASVEPTLPDRVEQGSTSNHVEHAASETRHRGMTTAQRQKHQLHNEGFANGDHVTIWNHRERRKIAGNAAPLGKNLDRYLNKHKECAVYTGQDLELAKERAADPSAANNMSVHVSIWNTNERRKIAGNAAPLMKNVEQYLKKHPGCEVYTNQDKERRLTGKGDSKGASSGTKAKRRALASTNAPAKPPLAVPLDPFFAEDSRHDVWASEALNLTIEVAAPHDDATIVEDLLQIDVEDDSASYAAADQLLVPVPSIGVQVDIPNC